MNSRAPSFRVRPLLTGLDRVGSRVLEEKIQTRADGLPPLLALTGSPARSLPDHARHAAIAAFDEPARRPSRGLPELRAAIARSLGEETGAAVDSAREVLVTNGAMQALNIVCRTLLEPGDRVLIPAPNFYLEGIVRLAGGEPVYVRCDEEEDWRWDLERMEAALTPRVKIFFACNPTNPTGYLPTRSDMAALLDLAERHDFIVLCDESYSTFVYDGAHLTSILSLRDRSDRWVLVRSLSKSYALTDWRIGYIVGPPYLIDQYTKVLEWEQLHCGYLPQRVATAVLDGPLDWLGYLAAEYQTNRDAVYRAAELSPSLTCRKPRAGPFLFLSTNTRLNTHMTELGESAVAERLLALGVPSVEGRYFGQPGYLRLAFGGNRDTIDRLCEILGTFMASAVPE